MKLAAAILVGALILIVLIALPSATPQIPSGREVVSPTAYISVEPVARGASFQIAVVLKIRNGFQTNCQHCNRLITFDTSSDDKNIRRALKSAKELRMAVEAVPENKGLAQGVVDRSQL